MISNEKEKEKLICLAGNGKVDAITMLPGGGGDRKYFRILFKDGKSAIGTVADDLKDSKAFVRLADAFAKNGVQVPRIYSHSPEYKYYIQEDLGDQSLYDIIKADSPEIENILRSTIKELVKMQTVPKSHWEEEAAYAPFSERLVKWDLYYFKYEFLKPLQIVFDEDALEDDFERLACDIMAAPTSLWGFQMRDCQSRNILVKDDKPWFIDFQGGRYGPGVYDAISLLWQAKANFPNALKEKMLEEYARCYSDKTGADYPEIIESSGIFILFRTLQVLGAYGFRGLIQKRAHFIESIPGALKNLSTLISQGRIDKYPELKRVCETIVSDKRFEKGENDKLTVKVFSFSYKKGYPEDYSGNGGGFMFDCRGMHNPGRYDEFKMLTGRDEPVKAFLKERREADKFASQAFDIVKPSVETYLRRGFSSLQIGFGCTGGRHRSVYCADIMAEMLYNAFPEIGIELQHRERDIKEILE